MLEDLLNQLIFCARKGFPVEARKSEVRALFERERQSAYERGKAEAEAEPRQDDRDRFLG